MPHRILIIGGTGTIGSALLHHLIDKKMIPCSSVRVLSRNEHRQKHMERLFRDAAVEQDIDLEFFLGDVADFDRMVRATREVDTVFNFAAIKHVDKAEYNPWESVKTNVVGIQNIIDACLVNEVNTAIFTSTDKAVEPFNAYGTSKAMAEHLWIAGNIGAPHTKFVAARYGNVFGSQGSVVELWHNALVGGKTIHINSTQATRFFMSIEDAVQLVMDARHIERGQILMPKMKSTTLVDLAKGLVAKDITTSEMNQAEKVHEMLISANEASMIYENEKYFLKMPNNKFYSVAVPIGFEKSSVKFYSSDTATRLTLDEITAMYKRVMKVWARLGFTK